MVKAMLGFSATHICSYAVGYSLGSAIISEIKTPFLNEGYVAEVAGAIIAGIGGAFLAYFTMNYFINKYYIAKQLEIPDKLAKLPKEGRIAAILGSDNFKTIVDRKPNEVLKVDVNGKLYKKEIEAVAYIMDAFFWNISTLKTSKVVQSICLHIFRAFCKEDLNKDILYPKSPNYLTHLMQLKKFCRSVQKMGPQFCDKLQPVIDLIIRPSAVEANLAFEQGIPIRFTGNGEPGGINGSYFLHNRRKQIIGVFKPSEKEATILGDRTTKSLFGVEPNTGYLHERLAYLLDKDHFAGVPETVIAKFPKKYFPEGGKGDYVGSMQLFVPGCVNAGEHLVDNRRKKIIQTIQTIQQKQREQQEKQEQWEWPLLLKWLDLIWPAPENSKKPETPPPEEIKEIPAHEIHKIAIFDIRALNCDRHLGNMLVDKDLRVYPIDHGFAYPGKARQIRYNWICFPQSNVPFSTKDLEYIASLNPDKDVELIRKKYPQYPEEGLFRVKIATMLLQIAARRGFTACQIADLMQARDVPMFKKTGIDQCYFEDEFCANLIKAGGLEKDETIARVINESLDLYTEIGLDK